jgi:hypothetical protein
MGRLILIVIYIYNINNPSAIPTVFSWGNNVKINNLGQIVYSRYYGPTYLATPQVEVAKKIYALCIGVRDKPGEEGKSEIRGDNSAKLMSLYLKNLPNVVYNEVLIGDKIGGLGVWKTEIESYLYDIKSKIKSGDALFLYIMAHGSESGWLWEQKETTLTTGNERLHIGKDILGGDTIELSDDQLYSMLDYILGGLDNVAKWIVIDACHSGGFWGNHNPDDGGDLEKLSNASLLAAAKEGYLAYAEDKTGIGLFTVALSEGFSKDADGKLKVDRNPRDGKITFEEIASWCQDWAKTNKYIGQVVIEMGLGDSIILGPDNWNPVAFKTADFVGGLNGERKVNMAPILHLLLN